MAIYRNNERDNTVITLNNYYERDSIKSTKKIFNLICFNYHLQKTNKNYKEMFIINIPLIMQLLLRYFYINNIILRCLITLDNKIKRQ